jgi:hypothetical protein
MTAFWTLALLQEAQETAEMPPMPELSPLAIIIICAIILFYIVVGWKVFEKAGQPGWTAIIPFVNYFFFALAAGKPAWWGILMFVPIVNIIVWFILCIDLAKRFRHGTGFGIGLALLGFIFFPILAFGDEEPGPARA